MSHSINPNFPKRKANRSSHQFYPTASP
jgi:hypothetical protein